MYDEVWNSIVEGKHEKTGAQLKGYKRFYSHYFKCENKLFSKLADKGQSPKTLMICCSDARVDPCILTDADPGDVFVIRNVASLVPAYQPEWKSYHGTSAAIEFAVNYLKVNDIVVIGHSNCGGIKALMDEDVEQDHEFSFISSWVNIAREARNRAFAIYNHKDRYCACEKEAIKTSMANLMTFPFIEDSVHSKKIKIHGWYFDLKDGSLATLDSSGSFTKIPV